MRETRHMIADRTPADARTPTPTEDAGATEALLLQAIAATYASPRDPLLDDLRSGRFAAALDALSDATGVAAPTLPPADATALQASYVDLFVSSGDGLAAPPYLGYAQDGELLGDTAEALGRFLKDEGIGTQETWTDLPDHVAAAAEAGVLLARHERTHAARDLLARWMRPWFDRYATSVADRDGSGFYGPLTTFLHATIREVTRGNGS